MNHIKLALGLISGLFFKVSGFIVVLFMNNNIESIIRRINNRATYSTIEANNPPSARLRTNGGPNLFDIKISEIRDKAELKRLESQVFRNKLERERHLREIDKKIKATIPPDALYVNIGELASVNFEKTPEQKMFTGDLVDCICLIIHEIDPKTGKNKVASISHIPPFVYSDKAMIDKAMHDQFSDFIKRGGDVNRCNAMLCGGLYNNGSAKTERAIQKYILNLFENSIKELLPNNAINVERCPVQLSCSPNYFDENNKPISESGNLIVSCSRDGIRVANIHLFGDKVVSSYGIDPIIDELKFCRDSLHVNFNSTECEIIASLAFINKSFKGIHTEDVEEKLIKVMRDLQYAEIEECNKIGIKSKHMISHKKFVDICRSDIVRMYYPNVAKLKDKICTLKNVNKENEMKL